MLQGLKRWLSSRTSPAPEWPELVVWAESRQFAFRSVRDAEGFVVEGRLGAQPWRLEWGPPQRSYVKGAELRLRAEMALPSELQVLVLNRQLQEAMERAVFDQYVEGVQTRIDNQTPPEMRWLVMFPKLAGSELGALRERFVALANAKPWLVSWLDGPLASALASTRLPPESPLVLMVARGRLTLRLALPSPDLREIETALRLFETAMRESRRAASTATEVDSPSTQPSLWSASAMSPDPRPE